jgi:hypothetical protein
VVDKDLYFRSLWWFGGKPGKPLPDITKFPHATRTTPNSDGMKPVRENTRRIEKAKFELIDGADLFAGVATRLRQGGRTPPGCLTFFGPSSRECCLRREPGGARRSRAASRQASTRTIDHPRRCQAH